MEALFDPTKLVEMLLPIEVQVKIRVYRAKDKSLIIQIVPVEPGKEALKSATEKQ